MLEAKIDMLRANLEEERKDKSDGPNPTGHSQEMENELATLKAQNKDLRAESARLKRKNTTLEKSAQESNSQVFLDQNSFNLIDPIYFPQILGFSLSFPACSFNAEPFRSRAAAYHWYHHSAIITYSRIS